MATDDSLLRDRIRPKSTLLESISRAPARSTVPDSPEEQAAPVPPAEERVSPLPLPGSPYDVAHARPENKPVPMLRFIFGDTVRGLPYANLDSIDMLPADKPAAGPSLVLRFNGIVAREARIAGRNLEMLYDLLSDYRVSWVRELPKGRDFKDAGATVITSIVIQRIKDMPD